MQVTNLTKQRIDEKALKTAAQIAAAVLGKKKLDKISLVFIGDAKMKELNKRYRGKNETTDVLSFEELNEIFISLPQVKRQAKLLKTDLKTELTRLLAHGIVHLAGYDHTKSLREAERMFAVEEKILEKISWR